MCASMRSDRLQRCGDAFSLGAAVQSRSVLQRLTFAESLVDSSLVCYRPLGWPNFQQRKRRRSLGLRLKAVIRSASLKHIVLHAISFGAVSGRFRKSRLSAAALSAA